MQLRKQAARAEQVRQEMLELSHRLELERSRFDAMQRFIRLAVGLESDRGFAALVCESIVDLLGCGVGLFWGIGGLWKDGGLVHFGLGEAALEVDSEVREWVGRWILRDEVYDGQGLLLPEALDVRPDYLVEVVNDSRGEPLALLFACNCRGQPVFHDEFQEASKVVFGTFANQVGVLMESFIRRSTIHDQIETIRVSEERLSMALTAGNVGLWDWNLKSGQVYFSSQWKRQLGYESEVIGNRVEDWSGLLHPEDLCEALDVANACADEPGSQFELILRMRHADGRWVWINTRGFNVSKPDAGIFRVIGIHLDVSGQKELERRLREAEQSQRRARQQAERESSAKSSFLATISHEIRTPLNGMMAAFQMLRHTHDEKDRSRILGMGERAGKWMLKIIGESLDIIRIESGKMELNPETTDLVALLDELRAFEEPKARKRNLDLQWVVASDVPRFTCADPVRLRQILANLLGNAIKFTDEGYVRLEVSVEKRSNAEARRVRFVVQDSGIGFSREFRRRMFEPFSQEIRKMDSANQGIGLGLMITRELVGLMGGMIRVRSRPGLGSRFLVRLPLVEVFPEGVDVEKPPLLNPPKFRGRVLLAEDDMISGELGRMMLQSIGLDVDLARNGDEALSMASAVAYDLIFMDCWMPGKSGLEVTRALRCAAGGGSSSSPIVALTANTSLLDERECLEAGMDGFLSKPLLIDNLVNLLSDLLGASE